uniref:Prolyl 4-hydroxylase alpha subunit domain-containing protein n=1 Tax=Timspurckia oligopyrenoides TaxID=708627 RepID=A0A7S0ZD96_9RHOD|mmetsp:Transcript_13229/g.23768  ORF Transcript_13229/g.23768 Transcript_13229/m.23768 type:complete len:327 (+) Transcript_13229:64-1044(+)
MENAAAFVGSVGIDGVSFIGRDEQYLLCNGSESLNRHLRKSRVRVEMNRGFGRDSTSASGSANLKKDSRKEEHDSGLYRRHLSDAVTRVIDEMIDCLKDEGKSGLFVTDGFLGPTVCAQLRKEAESLYEKNLFSRGKSSRHSSITKQQELYDKQNVLSMQVIGGEEQYDIAPKIVEYIVHLTRLLPTVISQQLKPLSLSNRLQSNKLAVCLGEGSAYDRHIDNGGGGDLRKLTLIYYLNPMWKSKHGGVLRAYDKFDASKYRDIEPIADRLVAFWSDSLVHEVLPMEGELSKEQRRYALTIWFCTDSVTHIHDLDLKVKQIHFPNV